MSAVMMCHLVRPVLQKCAAAALLGGIAFLCLRPAVSRAQGAGSEPSVSTAHPAQGNDTQSGSANKSTPENRPGQPAFDPFEARIKYLHNRLRITPAQQPLWASLVQVMRENEKSMASVLKERFQAAKTGNAIDALNADSRVGEAQLEALKKFTAAFQALYDSLTIDQKKIADAILRQPQFSEQAAVPPPYAAAPFPYDNYSPVLPPTYSVYPYSPQYSYFPYYYSFLFVGPRFGLGHAFFFPHHPGYLHPGPGYLRPGFVPFRPPAQPGVPPGRAAVIHAPTRR